MIPRLKELYIKKIRPELKEKFNFNNLYMAPQVKKIVLMINALIQKGKPIFGKLILRVDESKNIYPDLRIAKKILGWKNKTSLKEGLIKTIQFYKKKL